MEAGARTKLVTAVVLAAVFGSGLLLGYAVDTGVLSSVTPSEQAPATSGQSGEQAEPPQRRPYVYEQLHPTASQTAVIDSIMHVHRQRMNALDKEYRGMRQHFSARYNTLVQETREAIAGVFPTDVAEEYRRLLADFDRRREAERAAPESARD